MMSRKLRVSLSAELAAAVRSLADKRLLLPTPSAQAKRATVRDLAKASEYAVAVLGFSQDAVRAALEFFQQGGCLFATTTGSLLDYLCFQSDFPLPSTLRIHREGSTAGEVSILAVKRERVESRVPGEEPGGDRARVDDDSRLTRLAPLVASDSNNGTCAAGDKDPDLRAWVLNYATAADTSSESTASEFGDDDVEVGRSMPATTLEDPSSAREALGTALLGAQAKAKAAKAVRDSSSQQEAGAAIRELKQRMVRLGLTEEECVAAAHIESPVDPCVDSDLTIDDPPAADDGMCDIFDETAQVHLPAPSKRSMKATSKASVVATTEPRAMLQQLCKQRGWPAPRFERLQITNRGSYQYAVTVEQTVVGKKKQLLRCEVPGEHDSADTAQQMAACAALVRVCEELNYTALCAPYDSVVLNLLEAQTEHPATDRGSMESFIHSLMASATSEDAAQPTIDPIDNGGNDPGRSLSRNFRERHRALQPHLLRLLNARRSRQEYDSIAAQRANLPVAALHEALSSLLYDSECDAVLVVGETGSGKTTQIPQFVLDDATLRGHDCNVIVTQPRRIAAISVAERVAYERLEPAPGVSESSTVGYQVRNEAATCSCTRLLFCTMGILLRRLHSDALLGSVTAIVLDEIHERSVEVDLLLTLLRDLPARRRAAGMPPLKLVLMSATMDASLFSTYMGGCPVLTAEGRMFPVTTVFLPDLIEITRYILPPDSPAAMRVQKGQADPLIRSGGKYGRLLKDGWGDAEADALPPNPDYDASAYANYSQQTRVSMSRLNEEVFDFDLCEEVLAHIHHTQSPGSVLVFVSGIREVERMCTRLQATKRFADCVVLPLHSALSAAEQRAVFQTYVGRRKLVVSTNISETSITIPDIVFVVDSGRQRSKQYNAHRGISSLEEDWISKANAKQRAGRAGRVQVGFYYALYTQMRASRFRAAPVPEVQRIPLAEAALHIANLGVGHLHEVFACMPEPPVTEAVSRALQSLQDTGAMDADHVLTPMGRLLAQLPVDIDAGKLLIYGVIMGCTRHALTLAASMSNDKSPFVTDAAERMRTAWSAPGAAGLAAGLLSDHMVMLDVFEAWRSHDTESKAADYCLRNGLSSVVLKDIAQTRSALADLLSKAGFLPVDGWRQTAEDLRSLWNVNSRNAMVVRDTLLCASMGSHVAAGSFDTSTGTSTWFAPQPVGRVVIHPSSTLSGRRDLARTHPLVVYRTLNLTNQPYIHMVSAVSPVGLMLFGPAEFTINHAEAKISLLPKGDVFAVVDAETAVLVKALRRTLQSELMRRVTEPGVGPISTELQQAVTRLIRENGEL